MLISNPVKMSNFSYCSLFGFVIVKGENNEIIRTKVGELKALYGNYESRFEEFLDGEEPKNNTKEPKNASG